METLKALNADNTRKVFTDVPTSFVRKVWKSLVFTDAGVDRRFYELCTLSELKKTRFAPATSGCRARAISRTSTNTWCHPRIFTTLKRAGELPLAVATDCDAFLRERLLSLEQRFTAVNDMAKADTLPDTIITESGLKITPLTNSVPDETDALMRQAYGLLPRIKITELLLEVDDWTGFARHFTHIKGGEPATDKTLLLTAILSDAINLGLTKMVDSCPGTTYAKLSWLQAWYIRDETYSAALAELVNAQFRQSFAGHWGDGTASSSDGQHFKAGGRGEARGNINPKYGS